MAEEVLTQEKYIDFKNVKVNDHLVLSITESSKTVDQIKAAEKVSKIIFTTLTYIFIVALALLVIFPFYWMIITSLKTFTEITQENQTFFPSVVMWFGFSLTPGRRQKNIHANNRGAQTKAWKQR